MTGTQSLSVEQVRTISREVERIEQDARNRCDIRDTGEQGLVFTGQPVTVVIHQTEGHARRNVDKRVQVHRAFADSIHFWLDRAGKQHTTEQAFAGAPFTRTSNFS